MLSGVLSPSHRHSSRIFFYSRAAALLLPAVLLGVVGLRTEGAAQTPLWAGAGVEFVLFLVLALPTLIRRRPLGAIVTVLYLIALAWLWLLDRLVDYHNDGFSYLSQFVLLTVPLSLLAIQTLTDSGALASRRAHLLTQRLLQRQEWPHALEECKSLPEVKALRESLVEDVSPALALLQDPRPQVRMAALAALEFRAEWGTGQPELVLRFARQVSEPALRAAALTALANVKDRTLIEAIAEFLRDPIPEVRRAAVEALLWDSDHRWVWVRAAFRIAMGDAAVATDGPLVKTSAALLRPEVVTDLSAWAAEKGILGVRAAASLAAHYDSLLQTTPDSPMAAALVRQLVDSHSPPALRMELAQVLRTHDKLSREIQEGLLDPATPAPLRLLAADLILKEGAFPAAVTALREVSRMPNREMALATADIVQRRLGIDLGLALDSELPALQSRQAADVTRRLMRWASAQRAPGSEETGHLLPETKADASDRHPDNDSGAHQIGSGFI